MVKRIDVSIQSLFYAVILIIFQKVGNKSLRVLQGDYFLTRIKVLPNKERIPYWVCIYNGRQSSSRVGCLYIDLDMWSVLKDELIKVEGLIKDACPAFDVNGMSGKEKDYLRALLMERKHLLNRMLLCTTAEAHG